MPLAPNQRAGKAGWQRGQPAYSHLKYPISSTTRPDLQVLLKQQHRHITNQSQYANFVVTVAIKANLMLVICNSAAACALTTACTLTDSQMYRDSHTHLLWATDAEAAITCLRHTRLHVLEKAGIARPAGPYWCSSPRLRLLFMNQYSAMHIFTCTETYAFSN